MFIHSPVPTVKSSPLTVNWISISRFACSKFRTSRSMTRAGGYRSVPFGGRFTTVTGYSWLYRKKGSASTGAGGGSGTVGDRALTLVHNNVHNNNARTSRQYDNNI